MIDFHNHILPNVDDGSTSLEMSIIMLRNAADQGITDVVNTVHFQHPKVSDKEISYQMIKKKIKNLQAELLNYQIPINLHIGSEVFYYPNLVELLDEPLATIGNGKYMLIEFNPNYIPTEHREILFNLKMLGVTPIIAHPERYRDVHKNIDMVHKWIDAGCIIQVDAGSILGHLGKKAKKTSELILKKELCQILGSDAHNDLNRNFVLYEAFLLARTWIGKKANKLVYDNPRAVIDGQKIKVEFEEEYNKFHPNLLDRIIGRFNK